MKIRIAQINDLPALVRIYNQAIQARKTADMEPFSPAKRIAWFENHDPEKYPIFVAQENAEIRGYLSISAYRQGRQALQQTAEVSYYIHQNYFRMGIASALMKYAHQSCPGLALKTLIAILLENNEESVSLLKKFGYVEWGKFPAVADFDGDEVGQLIYGKRIVEL